MLQFTTIDLNTGGVVGVRDVSIDDVNRARDIFEGWLLPAFRKMNRRDHLKAFIRNGRHTMTVWCRWLNYCGEAEPEWDVNIRLSWKTDVDELKHLLRVGFTLWDAGRGRWRTPWIIHQGGVITVYMSERLFTVIDSGDRGGGVIGVGGDAWRRAVGLSNVS